MKNIILLIIFSSASIFAQNNIYISSNVGLNLSYPKAPFNNVWGLSYNLGIGIGHNLSEELSTEIIYQYSKHKLSTFTNYGHSNYQFINAFLLRWNYILFNSHLLRPFVSFGMGISYLELNGQKRKWYF